MTKKRDPEDWVPGHFQVEGQSTGAAIYFPTEAALRGYEEVTRSPMIRVNVTPAAKP